MRQKFMGDSLTSLASVFLPQNSTIGVDASTGEFTMTTGQAASNATAPAPVAPVVVTAPAQGIKSSTILLVAGVVLVAVLLSRKG